MATFRGWLQEREEKDVQVLIEQFNDSEAAKELLNNLKSIETLLALSDSHNSCLKLNLGVGEARGKSSMKFGMTLKESASSTFSIGIDIKVKKRSELRQFLEAEIKKGFKSTEYNSSKLFKVNVTETEKTVRVDLTSAIL